MSTRHLLISACLVTAFASPMVAVAAQSDADIDQSAAASRGSVVASTKLAAAGVRLVAGVAFSPVRRTLRDSGRAARAAGDSGRFVEDSSNDHLDVSPETVQAQPAPQVPYDARDTSDRTDDRRNAAAATPGVN